MTNLRNADSVQQLKTMERKQFGQNFDIFYVCFRVMTAVIFLGTVKPGCYIST